ncbi:RHS repeat domain-containing protein [Piscirickettsia litoralis]|uniref:DUF6531 domain-containing protein n=1 Tax=Piscirickettsia litoralis TaxID=1891921 RepID=A0ABX2ZYW7_9GAMM|nr:RHS repeat domain-containing protein [Piscirickettsia litoralis]ODN41418.1 hypothetical protein BGC07_16780 [Piscirickettsia litoralis]
MNRTTITVALLVGLTMSGQCISKNIYRYETAFESEVVYPPKHFSDLKTLETYLHSFGYLSAHLKLSNEELYPGGQFLMTYSVPSDTITFSPTKTGTIQYSSGSHTSENIEDILVQACSCQSMTGCQTAHFSPKNDWELSALDNGGDRTGNRSIIYSREYNCALFGDDGKPYSPPTVFSVYKSVAYKCNPPETDQLTNPYDLNLAWYILENRSNPICTVSQTGDSGLEAHVTKILIGSDNSDNKGCKLAGDPIDIASGYLQEQVEDYSTHTINPIQIIRFYNSGTKRWSFNYQQHLSFTAEGKATLTKANGDSFSFKSNYKGYDAVDGAVGKLKKIGLMSYEYTRPNGAKELYDYNGQLTQITTAKGQILSLTSDTDSLTISDAFQHKVIYRLDGGHITSVTLPNTFKINYSYGQLGQLSSVHYPNGREIKYNYNKNGLVAVMNKNSQTVSSWNYNKEGKVIKNEETQ